MKEHNYTDLIHIFFSSSSTVYIHFEGFVNHRRNYNGIHVIAFGLLMRKGAGLGDLYIVTFLKHMVTLKKVETQ